MQLRAALDAARSECAAAERRRASRGLLVAIPHDDPAAEGRAPGVYGGEVVYAGKLDLEERLAGVPAPEGCERIVILCGPAHIDPPEDAPRARPVG